MALSSTLAKNEDGEVQINFKIPYSLISKTKKEVLEEYAKNLEIPGFRKGKAPIDKVEANVGQNSLIEHILRHILPQATANAIGEYKLKLAIYPKFELISAKDGQDWQIRAVSCELPLFELGNYKKVIAAAGKKGLTREEKEQLVIKILLETINISIPKVLIDEEVNTRLANLLERIEKLGISLESYLASIRKTTQTIRAEYEKQAKDAIALDLILNKIAEKQEIKVEENEIDKAIKAASADRKLAEKLNTPEQRRIIGSVLRRKASLDSLVALV